MNTDMFYYFPDMIYMYIKIIEMHKKRKSLQETVHLYLMGNLMAKYLGGKMKLCFNKMVSILSFSLDYFPSTSTCIYLPLGTTLVYCHISDKNFCVYNIYNVYGIALFIKILQNRDCICPLHMYNVGSGTR